MAKLINSIMNFRGEFFALSAAFLWAAASIWSKTVGKTVKPIELNLLKGIGGFLLFLLTSLLIGDHYGAIPGLVIWVLIISGAVGIGFGDTMFFETINRLGANRALLITTLAPPMAAILGQIFLQEKLSLVGWLGILVTLVGVIWVVTEKDQENNSRTSADWLGVFFGFLAALSQAAGAVLSRWALADNAISALQSAVIRLFAGTAVLVLWLVLRREKIGAWLTPRPQKRTLWLLAGIVVLGCYCAIWLQQLSFEFSEVGIASTLLATSPLFVLPIAAIKKEKLSLRSVLGVIVALVGVGFIFLAQ